MIGDGEDNYMSGNAMGDAIFGGFEDYRFSKQLVQLCDNSFLDAAIVSKLYQWTEFNRIRQSFQHHREGKWWAYGTYEYWQEKEFPGVSTRTLRRAFERLETKGYITRGHFSYGSVMRTSWYTVNAHVIYSEWTKLIEEG